MKIWMDRIMQRRAAALTARLGKYITCGSHVADIGSGTGHNADYWRTSLGAAVDEYDVADLHWVGAGPKLYAGVSLPAPDAAYEVVTLLFVLQYAPDPLQFLREVRRTCGGRLLVIQSTYRGGWGRTCLALRELIWGRLAFCIARLVSAIDKQPCPLIPQRAFTRSELRLLWEQAGFLIHAWEPSEWWALNISRDLYVLEPVPESWMSQLSSPPAMKHAG